MKLSARFHFDKKIITLSDRQTTILYTATLKAKIDPEGILDFVKHDDRQKITIIQRNNDLQDAIQKNDKLAASLTEQYNQATFQAERDRVRRQMNDADRDFLANEKLQAGNKLYYARNFNGAIKFYGEALQIKPNYFEAYNNRGFIYGKIDKYEPAVQDFNKAIQFNPNRAELYSNRGIAYILPGNLNQAIADATKAVELDPNYANAYQVRGLCRQALGNVAKSQSDFAKAKEPGFNS